MKTSSVEGSMYDFKFLKCAYFLILKLKGYTFTLFLSTPSINQKRNLPAESTLRLYVGKIEDGESLIREATLMMAL